MEEELKDSNAARKMQKADREKLRRDRLNEHFLKLGKTIGNPFESSNYLSCFYVCLSFKLVLDFFPIFFRQSSVFILVLWNSPEETFEELYHVGHTVINAN